MVARSRDAQGQLIRSGGQLPPGVQTDAEGMRVVVGEPVSFGTMFRQVRRYQGLTDAEAEASWAAYLAEHPHCGRGGI